MGSRTSTIEDSRSEPLGNSRQNYLASNRSTASVRDHARQILDKIISVAVIPELFLGKLFGRTMPGSTSEKTVVRLMAWFTWNFVILFLVFGLVFSLLMNMILVFNA